jgi:SAM-dependent methyltransferase
VPTYVLDKNYYFLDWNTAFDVVVAGQLGLQRTYSHAGEFISALANVATVFERSKRIFATGREPLVDAEALVFESKRFGTIEFHKLATQTADNNARLAAWTVCLNISHAEQADKIWEEVTRRLQEDLHWARYAISYDKLLLNFDDYGELVAEMIDKLQACSRCIDLGAGTGNGTLKLLQSRPDRRVCAVEANHAMLQGLIDKVASAEDEAGRDYFGRLTPLREDILRLNEVKVLASGSFDGALLMNVLYTLDDPERCLRETYELLKPGGVLVLSTSHNETNVDRLFERMRESLQKRGLYESLRSNYEDARRRHEDMMDRIHRDTKADIRHYVEQAGFQIRDWKASYVDAVVIVEAVKP